MSGFSGFDNFALTRAAVVLGVLGSLSSSVNICFLNSFVCEVSRSLSFFFVDLRAHILRTWC